MKGAKSFNPNSEVPKEMSLRSKALLAEAVHSWAAGLQLPGSGAHRWPHATAIFWKTSSPLSHTSDLNALKAFITLWKAKRAHLLVLCFQNEEKLSLFFFFSPNCCYCLKRWQDRRKTASRGYRLLPAYSLQSITCNLKIPGSVSSLQ